MDGRVIALAVDGTGTLVATGSVDGLIAEWERLSGKPVNRFFLTPSTGAALTTLAFSDSPTAARLLSIRANRVLTAQTENTVSSTVSLPAGLTVRTILPLSDGAMLLATNRGIYRWFQGKVVALNGTESLDVQSIAMSADRRWLAWGRRGGPIGLAAWTGERLGNFRTLEERHASSVNALAFAPRSQLLASAGADGSIRLFPFRNDGGVDPSSVFTGHTGWVEALEFADDTVLYSAGADGTVRGWFTQPGALIASICQEVARRRMFPLSIAATNTMGSMLPGRLENGCTLVDQDGRVKPQK
jgi:WD40 repeat protein